MLRCKFINWPDFAFLNLTKCLFNHVSAKYHLSNEIYYWKILHFNCLLWWNGISVVYRKPKHCFHLVRGLWDTKTFCRKFDYLYWSMKKFSSKLGQVKHTIGFIYISWLAVQLMLPKVLNFGLSHKFMNIKIFMVYLYLAAMPNFSSLQGICYFNACK